MIGSGDHSKSPIPAIGSGGTAVRNLKLPVCRKARMSPYWPIARSACDHHRPWIKEQVCLGRNAVAIYQDLVGRFARMSLGTDNSCAFIPCDQEAGHEAEVDWGMATAILAGEESRMKFFCMRSKYSGKHFVRCYPCERQPVFFDAHIHAFSFFCRIFPVCWRREKLYQKWRWWFRGVRGLSIARLPRTVTSKTAGGLWVTLAGARCIDAAVFILDQWSTIVGHFR